MRCPVYQLCQLRLQGVWCLSNHEDCHGTVNDFVDDDDPDPASLASIGPIFSNGCWRSGRIFRLVRRLAVRYQVEVGVDRLPVPADLINVASDGLPIEVRRVPLKAYHGAVWRLSDCWLVQLNSNDTPARQRFSLYHEIFHILAHCKATPVFKRAACSREGCFNELLADHFSASILLPRKQIMDTWLEVKDISQMAAIFDVPQSVMLIALTAMGLI